MRDLIITQNITLDGVIDASAGWFSPAEDQVLDDVNAVQRRHSAAADAFLTGRQTFEDMRGYWPHVEDDQTGVTDYLNRVHKYVVSTTLEDPGWEPTTILRGVDEIEPLKGVDGKDIVVTGSLTLVRTLVPSGLVDEYRLFVYPVVLGAGQKLFEDGVSIPRLECVEATRFESGITLLRYRP